MGCCFVSYESIKISVICWMFRFITHLSFKITYSFLDKISCIQKHFNFLSFLVKGIQFKIATLYSPPYVTAMIPLNKSKSGVPENYAFGGMFADVFFNLKVKKLAYFLDSNILLHFVFHQSSGDHELHVRRGQT